MSNNRTHSTFEHSQPWVVYTYGLTHDRWWPLWSSTRVLGRMQIICECMVCGDRTVGKLRIPRFGPVPEPVGGKHPLRAAYLAEHRHPDRGHPMSWAKPLLNLEAHHNGIDLDLLALRLEADLNQGPDQ